jgi:hypothetical protein
MFLIKQNDTLPVFEALLKTQVEDQDPVPVDLTGASVVFKMQPSDGGPLKVNAPAVILDALTGNVEYQWIPADTDTVGSYLAEFEVTFLSGKLLSFPTVGYLTVQVVPSI